MRFSRFMAAFCVWVAVYHMYCTGDKNLGHRDSFDEAVELYVQAARQRDEKFFNKG